jgi:HlyD family secretion protein
MKTERDTRERILRASAEVFAARGYTGATTRAICAAAGVNAALVNYYFRSKSELYHAVVAMLFENTAQPLTVLPDGVVDAASWRRALRDWVRLALSISSAEQPPASWCASLMAQEQCLPSAMADEIHRRFARPVHESLRRLIRMGMRAPDDEMDLNLRASSVASQCVVYALRAHWEQSFKPSEVSRQAWLDHVAAHITYGLLGGLVYQGASARPAVRRAGNGAQGVKRMKKRIQGGLMVALAALTLGATGCGKARGAAQAKPLAVRVRAIAPAEREFVDGATVQGMVRARNSARVAARVAGAIEAMLVVEGQAVTNGQALFRTDRMTAQEQVRLRQEDQRVAAAGQREAEAAVSETEAVRRKAVLDRDRMHKLFDQSQAVTQDAVERADTELVRAESACARARAGSDLATAHVHQADTSLDIAAKQLADTLVCAPFDAVVTRKLLDTGDFAKVGDGVLDVEDPRRYEAAFTLSAEHYDRVREGETSVLLGGGLTANVRYRSPTVHPVTRTFEIRVDLPADAAGASGRLCAGTVVFARRKGVGVPDTAVGERDKQPIVFVVKDGRATQVPVQTGLSWQGWTEIRSADAVTGKSVVAEGQLLLDDGDAVRTE